MNGTKLLEEIRLTNLLSYGPAGVSLKMEPLNVLIGPNASGKSNLISALGLLASTPKDLAKFLREEGGIQEWRWKGTEIEKPLAIWVEFTNSELGLQYQLDLSGRVTPHIEDESLIRMRGRLSLYSLQHGILERSKVDGVPQSRHRIVSGEIKRDQSILSQLKDLQQYPELTWLGLTFGEFSFFKNWDFGRDSAVRRPQPADLPSDFLLEDASNLGLVLSDLVNNHPSIKRLIIEKLKLLYERVEDLTVHVQGGTVQVFFHERGLRRPVPARRLSDGTLLYLCLLTILLHPDPPPLICLEEPETGLHPDAIQSLAELLIDAASRTQLVVTTHSDTLVSALSEVPEAIVVCERGDEGTTLRRLEPGKLAEWLEYDRLGELWSMGEIGGNRW
jgi:predicted ATPase